MRLNPFLFRHLSATFVVFLLLLQIQNVVSFPTPSDLAAEKSQSFAKRGCFLSKVDTDDLPVCSTLSVEYFNELILDYNYLPQRDCLFYLGLGGAKGQELGRRWYCQERSFGRGAVAWDTALPEQFHSDMFSTYFPKQGPKIGDPSQQDNLFGISATLLSQAMGENCNGNVYFFTPTANDGTDPIVNVWYQFEYPALTRNPAVQSILKIDPSIKDDDGNFADEGTVIWTPAHGPSSNAPLGDGYSFTYDGGFENMVEQEIMIN
jgi:hypothetical protein